MYRKLIPGENCQTREHVIKATIEYNGADNKDLARLIDTQIALWERTKPKYMLYLSDAEYEELLAYFDTHPTTDVSLKSLRKAILNANSHD